MGRGCLGTDTYRLGKHMDIDSSNLKQIAAGGIQSVQIPSCIANGDYLLRFEIIALHSASTYPGAQFYV